MPTTHRTRPSPLERHRGVPEKQIHRWLDDGGADVGDPHQKPTPVTWSPVALSARLDAERALHALCAQPHGSFADARRAISRIIRQVEGRQIGLDAATSRLRDLTGRLEQHLLADQRQHRLPAWQLLRRRTAVA